MTHHSVMTSSLRILKKLKIAKYDDFSSDIDSNSKTNIFVFRDVISFIINQWEPRSIGRLLRTQNVRQPRSASEACL